MTTILNFQAGDAPAAQSFGSVTGWITVLSAPRGLPTYVQLGDPTENNPLISVRAGTQMRAYGDMLTVHTCGRAERHSSKGRILISPEPTTTGGRSESHVANVARWFESASSQPNEILPEPPEVPVAGLGYRIRRIEAWTPEGADCEVDFNIIDDDNGGQYRMTLPASGAPVVADFGEAGAPLIGPSYPFTATCITPMDQLYVRVWFWAE
jgi:hypothetical protein